MNTVHQLRKADYKVRVEHRRKYWDPINKKWLYLTKYEHSLSALPNYITMESTGGYTTVTITTPDGLTTQGISKCSKYDKYEKKLGVALALQEALLGVLAPKQEDKQLEFSFVNQLNNNGCHNGHCQSKCSNCECDH